MGFDILEWDLGSKGQQNAAATVNFELCEEVLLAVQRKRDRIQAIRYRSVFILGIYPRYLSKELPPLCHSVGTLCALLRFSPAFSCR